MENSVTVPFIGYTYDESPLVEVLESEFDVKADVEPQFADIAIRTVPLKKHPLIIMKDRLGLNAPSDIPGLDVEDITAGAYLALFMLQYFRELDNTSDTPIMVLYWGTPFSSIEKQDYIDAGADKIIDMLNIREILKEYRSALTEHLYHHL